MQSRKTIYFYLLSIMMAVNSEASDSFNIHDYDYAMGDHYLELWDTDEQTQIDADIEANRKADAFFSLDIPADTVVTVQQIKHAFFFGAQIFNFDQFSKPEYNEAYKNLWLTLFNSATLPYYWSQYEPTPDEFNTGDTAPGAPVTHKTFDRRPPINPLIEFCDAHGIRKHGHPIVWGNNRVQPDWVIEKIPKEIFETEFYRKEFRYENPDTKRLATTSYWCVFGDLTEEQFAEKYPEFIRFLNGIYAKRISDLAVMYGDKIDSWDVVNESVKDTMPASILGTAPRMLPGGKITKSVYGAMPGDYVWRSFKLAEAMMPKTAALNINEAINSSENMAAPYAEQIKSLLRRGAKIDTIGCQMHIFSPSATQAIAKGTNETHSPAWQRRVLGTLSSLGLPIHISEVTIMNPLGGTDARGEAMQAVLAYNLYRLWFSTKNINGITWWNTVDYSSGIESFASGILQPDMTRKPVYQALDDLINHQWKTNLKIKTNQNGSITFRGFRGTYRLSWTDESGNQKERIVEIK